MAETTSDEVLLKFTADAKQAVAETGDLEKALARLITKYKLIPQEVTPAEKKVESLGEKMKKFAREERGEARTAGFFVSQLEAIIPKGTVAANVVGELTQALVGGVGLGMAFGVVGIAANMVAEHFAAAGREAKAFSDAAVKSVEEAQGRIKALRDNVTSRSGLGGTARNAKAAAQAALMEMEKDLRAMEARQKAGDDTKELQQGIDKIKKEILEAKVSITTMGFSQLGAEANEFNAEARKRRDKRSAFMKEEDDKETAARDQHQREMAAMLLAAERQGLSEREQLVEEFNQKWAQTTRADTRVRVALREGLYRALQAVDQKEADAEQKRAFEAAKRVNDAVLKAEEQKRAALLQAYELLYQHRDEQDAAAEAKRLGAGGAELVALQQKYEKLLEAARLAGEDEVALTEEYEKKKAEIRERYSASGRVMAELKSMGEGALRSIGDSAAREFGKATRSSAAYERAMRKAGQATQAGADLSAAAFAAFTQNALASVGEESAARALFETAMGFAALARSYWDPSAGKEATEHFTSAGMFAAVAALTGAAAYGIGQSRGMTKAERADVAAAEKAQAGTAPGAGSPGGSSSVGAAGGTVTVRETVFVIGNPLLSDAENARIAARTLDLAKRLDMVRR